jgi:trehalose/maltose transport system substrate-binding protein
MKRMWLTAIMLSALGLGSGVAQTEPVQITAIIGETSGYEIMVELAERYMEAHPGVQIEVRPGSALTDELFATYTLHFEREAGVDIVQLDVIWPGTFAINYMVDLYQYGAAEHVGAHFPQAVNNNTVGDKLIALPWFTDAGLLYYRTDLLEKYGFDGPPATWNELEEMARTIQEGERAEGNADFWGFVFQALPYEGLTVNALEWIASAGGGTIISPEGVVTVNNAAAAAMLERAASWLGTIAPRAVLGFTEEESRSLWQAGNAAFLRNWPYVYPLANHPQSPVAGKVGVARLPSLDGETPAAGLGGWGLGVTNFSAHPEVAADIVFYFASHDAQKRRAIEGGFAPTLPALYEDDEVLAANPFFADLVEVLETTMARPSAVSAPHYQEVSRAFYEAVHSVLRGEISAEEALEVLELDLTTLTGLPSGAP